MKTKYETARRGATSLLHHVRQLDENGNTDDALDLLLDETDDMMWAGRFSDLDAMIAGIRADDFSGVMLVGILTATLPAGDKLQSRPKFFEDVEVTLRRRGELEAGLLTGLE